MHHLLPHFSNLNIAQFPESLDQLLKQNQEKIKALLQQKPPFTWDNLMHPLEGLDDALSKQWSPLSHLHAVMNSPELRKTYKACLPMLSAYEARISHHQALYQALASIDTKQLNTVQQKILADTLRNFKLAGVALPPEKQARFEAINTRLSELSNQFETNILDAVDAYQYLITDEKRLSGLPQHAILSARERAKAKQMDGWLFNLETPCYLAVMTYADDSTCRETLYEAFVTRASDQGPHNKKLDNTPIIQEILAYRDEKARLLGFNGYAEYAITTKMVDTPKTVFDFIQNLIQQALPKAKKEIKA